MKDKTLRNKSLRIDLMFRQINSTHYEHGLLIKPRLTEISIANFYSPGHFLSGCLKSFLNI